MKGADEGPIGMGSRGWEEREWNQWTNMVVLTIS